MLTFQFLSNYPLDQIIQIGLPSSIIGGIAVKLGSMAWSNWHDSRADYSGKWEIKIFDKNGEVVKRDHLVLKQRNSSSVYGKINRIEPEEYQDRAWKFEGRLKGKSLIVNFWPTSKPTVSFGCWYMRQDDDNHFQGYYLTVHKKAVDHIKRVKLDMTRI